ncbi:hypothetical protein [Roseivivax sp. CAU 1761]
MSARAAAPLLVLLAGTAAADGARDAATCAALWEGYARQAARSAHLDGAAEARADAQFWTDRAVALGADPETLAAGIAREAPDMRLMVEAAIAGDRQSADLLERALARCDRPR